MNILYVWSDKPNEFNCSQHRMFTPALALQRAGHQAELIFDMDWSSRSARAYGVSQWADLIVFQRNVWMQNFPAILYWRAHGKKIVIDLDDHYKGMYDGTGSPSARFWQTGMFEQDGKMMQLQPGPLSTLEWGVKITGAVSSPSIVICEDWAHLARTYCVPNLLDLRFYRRKEVYKEPGVVYVGWGGSLGHLIGWRESGVLLALKQIVKDFKQVKIVFYGDDRAANLKDKADRLLDIPSSRKVIRGWVPYVNWAEALSLLDIGLIPLAGEYDLRRSPLKSLEFTAVGMPWVGSDIGPNREVGCGKLVQNTAKDWYTAIAEYITYLPAYTAQARNVDIERARVWSVDENIDNLLRIYGQIVQEVG